MSRPLPKWVVTLIQGALLSMTTVVLLVTLFVSMPAVETRFFPVVQHLEIDNVAPASENRSVIYGHFNKVRQCDYIGISWFRRTSDGALERVPVELMRRAGDTSSPTRPTGRQVAGPWVIGIPPEEVRFVSIVELTHRCHPFWTTVTQFYP